MTDWEEFEQLLDTHYWHFREASDDRIRKTGEIEWKRLQELRDRLGTRADHLFQEYYNKHHSSSAPPYSL